MAKVRLNTEQITDWPSFHNVFKQTLGFPDFYGMNMDAWVDCLTYLRSADGMSSVQLVQGEILELEIPKAMDFKARVPELFDALIECSAFVNQRYVESGDAPALALVFVE